MNFVAGVLIAIFVTMVVVIGLIVLAAVLSARSLAQRNRVSPSRPTQAPNLWVLSQGHAARSHRRLQQVAMTARAAKAAAGVSGSQVADLAIDLERQACALDDQVVLASGFSTQERAKRLYDLDKPIKELEQLAARISILAGHFSSQSPMATQPLGERVRVMEEAIQEVRQLEAEARAEIDALGPLPELPSPGTPWWPQATQPAPPQQAPVRRLPPPPGSGWNR